MACHVKKLISFSVGAVGAVSGMVFYQTTIREKLNHVSAIGERHVIPSSSSIDGLYGDHNGIMKLGYPSTENIKPMKSYVSSYNQRTKIPNWGCEVITPCSDTIAVTRKDRTFLQSGAVDTFFQSSKSDFEGSGFDRGHLVSAGNHKDCKESYAATYTYTNVVPMYPHFNNGIWNQLEIRARKLAAKHGDVSVCSGPLFLPRNKGERFVKYNIIGKNDVAVPTHFFKAMAWKHNDSGYDVEAYILPHEPSPSHKDDHSHNAKDKKSSKFKQFYASKEAINKAAGLTLFPNVPDEEYRQWNEEIPINQRAKNSTISMDVEDPIMIINVDEPSSNSKDESRSMRKRAGGA